MGTNTALIRIVFIGILVYMGVPKMLVSALDARAARIRSDLDEARRLREEAQNNDRYAQ